MKYLKKINENNDSKKEYIEQCFIDFLDNGHEFKTNNLYSSNSTTIMEMFIDIPEQTTITIDGLLEFSNYLNDTTIEINESFEKIKIKYPNIECYAEVIKDTSYNSNSELYLSINVRLIYKTY